jgi:pyruvate kinase
MKEILCTLGPSSLDSVTIRELERSGVTLFRVNMSHSTIPALEAAIELVRANSSVPLCIDTEGAQIRTGEVAGGTLLRAGEDLILQSTPVMGDSTRLTLTPAGIAAKLPIGAVLSVDFDSVILRVSGSTEDGVRAVVVSGGDVGTRKAVTALPAPELPNLTPKDREAVAVGRKHGITNYALSFAGSAADVNELRALAGPDVRIMAKIESRQAVQNLDQILQAADAALIDRGDMSREVRIEFIPLLQKAIIRKANAVRTPVYVATNLLESMVTKRSPTRAEANDVMNTLLDGADGLVLAAETAIGQYPVDAVKMVSALISTYTQSLEGFRVDDLVGQHPLLGY